MRKIIKAFPEQLKQAKIIETLDADYRWRIVLTPSKWIVIAMKLAEDVDYGNFKNAASANGIDTHSHHQVWSIMMAEQRREEALERTTRNKGMFPELQEPTGDWIIDEEEDDEIGSTIHDGQCPDCRVNWQGGNRLMLGTCPDCGMMEPGVAVKNSRYVEDE